MAEFGTNEPPRRTALGPKEVCHLAAQLHVTHGERAAEVAAFFAEQHRFLGDDQRTAAWQAVKSVLMDLRDGRLEHANFTIH